MFGPLLVPPARKLYSFAAYNNTLRTDVTGDNTAFIIPHDAEYFDNGACHSGGTFTAPIAGSWYLEAAYWANGGVAHLQWIITLTQAGSVARSFVSLINNAQADQAVRGGSIFNCAIGDTVTVTAQVGGGTGTKVIDIPADGARTTFAGHWIGA